MPVGANIRIAPVPGEAPAGAPAEGPAAVDIFSQIIAGLGEASQAGEIIVGRAVQVAAGTEPPAEAIAPDAGIELPTIAALPTPKGAGALQPDAEVETPRAEALLPNLPRVAVNAAAWKEQKIDGQEPEEEETAGAEDVVRQLLALAVPLKPETPQPKAEAVQLDPPAEIKPEAAAPDQPAQPIIVVAQPASEPQQPMIAAQSVKPEIAAPAAPTPALQLAAAKSVPEVQPQIEFKQPAQPMPQIAAEHQAQPRPQPTETLKAALLAQIARPAPVRLTESRETDVARALAETKLHSIFSAPAPLPVQPLAPPEPQPVQLAPAAAVEAPQQLDVTELLIEHELDMAQDGEWLDQLAKDIARTAGGDNAPLRFRLNPENLGSLRVEITPDRNGTAVRLTADNETARAIIADAQPRLVAEARAQGVRISETHVDVGHQNSGDPRRQAEEFHEAPIRTARLLQEEEQDDGKPTHGRSERYA